MRVLIIEDEIRAANQLQSMLKKAGFSYELLGIIDTVEDALSWFENGLNPDLVFMDIQLADGLSFEIFQTKKVEAPIIFTTAYDQYAIQAFKVNSIDNSFIVAVEESSIVDGIILRVGDIVKWNKLQFLIGTQFTKNVASISGGIGIKLGVYNIKYGIQFGSQSLGIPQMLDVSVVLP